MNPDDFGALLGLTCTFSFGAFVVLWIVLLRGIFTVEPNEAHLLLYFGKYSRTVSEPGLRFAFPIGLNRLRISTRMEAIALPVTTVVEARGNPIQVSCVVVYKIVDAARALLDVRSYHPFVAQQASTVLKTVCAHYPYEGRTADEPSLKHESPQILDALQKELGRLVAGAGIQVALVRLNDLTYAPEIAQSMLLRQQALAMVDARRTLVDGAITTVSESLRALETAGIKLTPPARERLAANLTLLLCAGERGESHSTVVTRMTR